MIALLWINTLINVAISAMCLYGAAKSAVFNEDIIVRTGLIIAVFGLLGQAMRNLQYHFTGVSPLDIDLPFWMLKDLGITILVLGYAIRGDMIKSFGRT